MATLLRLYLKTEKADLENHAEFEDKAMVVVHTDPRTLWIEQNITYENSLMWDHTRL